MPVYEYGRIAKLDENLRKAGIDLAVVDEIMEGGAVIKSSTSPEKKAAWMKTAMQRMNRLLGLETRHIVREACACCLGGKREALVKQIARNYDNLEERIRAANEAKLVFGHSVTLQEDGRVLVRFAPDESTNNRCVCLPKAEGVMPVTYCYCCGGHIKHHLQIALDRELAVIVRSSALSSGGKRPCSFWFTIKPC
jgi:hypothetical protein